MADHERLSLEDAERRLGETLARIPAGDRDYLLHVRTSGSRTPAFDAIPKGNAYQ